MLTLLEDKEWSGWSNRTIAKRCGVSPDLVDRLRREVSLPDSGSDDSPAPRTYTTKHDTTATMNPPPTASEAMAMVSAAPITVETDT